MLWVAKQTHLLNNLYYHTVTVLLLRTLMHEFARVSRAIIHAAVKSKKLPSVNYTAD
jgi:hypothetical protein